MAISNDLLRQYADIAGGRGSGEQALAGVASAGLGAALASIPGAREKLQMTMRDSFTNPFQPLQSFFTSDVSTWKDLDEMPVTAGEAYKNFSQSLSGRQKRIAKREGVLDAIGYVQKYNQRKNVVVPIIAQQLQGYAAANPNEDMEKLMEKLPKLRNYLNNNLSELERAKMPYLTPSKTAAETLGDFFSPIGGLTDVDPTTQGIGSFLPKVGVGIASPVIGGMQLANLAGKGVSEAFGGGKGARVAGEGVEALGTQAALARARLLRGPAQELGTKTVEYAKSFPKIDTAINAIKKVIKKRGSSGTIKLLAKKLGFRKAAALAAKIGIGTVGGALSGGALTAAMLAMGAKDIYDIYNIVMEEAKTIEG